MHSHGQGQGAEMQTVIPHFLVYSFAYIAECGAKERLVNKVSPGGMCSDLSFY